VKLSVKSDYAARALLALARHCPLGVAQKVEDLAAECDVPPNYLVQILIELKAEHLVRSLRGKEGGYLLARAPSEITLGEVLRAIHGQVFDSTALVNSGCPAELQAAWRRLQQSVDAAADAITFQQLLDEGTAKDKMYYI
jgi:Rrf2 family transcriptional regulator, cysteine metabolism repressor